MTQVCVPWAGTAAGPHYSRGAHNCELELAVWETRVMELINPGSPLSSTDSFQTSDFLRYFDLPFCCVIHAFQ